MIDVYCSVALEHVQEITQLASCGVLLVFRDKHNIRYRLMGYSLGASSSDLANIQSIRLALATINPVFRKATTLIHVSDESILKLLSDAGQYTQTLDELLRWCEYYSDLGFVVESPDNENIRICQSLAKRICASQQTYDSSTLDHLPNES